MNAIPVPFDLDDALETSRYLANVVNGADAETHRAPLRWTGWSDDTIFAATVRNRGTGGKGLEVLGSGGASVLQVTDSGLSATAAALVGALTVGGTLGVTGAATVGGTLGVTGAISGASLSTGAGAISGGTISGTALVGGTVSGTTGAFSGDLAVDTDVLKVDVTTNRVGVNTATPAVALDVVGALAASGAISGASLSTGAGAISGGAISGTTGAFSGNLAVATTLLLVDVSGSKVGIGKTPTSKLDVSGTVAATGFINGTVLHATDVVGIGTSSPDAGYVLDVVGKSSFSDDVELFNSQAYQGVDSGGTARNMLEMTSGDVVQVGNTATQTLIRGGTTAGLGVIVAQSSGRLGFYGTAAQAKQSVTGSRGGNAALDSLLTALDQLGLISNNSS